MAHRRRRGASAQAHHERAREAVVGDAELPPEDDAVDMASAVHVLDSVAEVGPNYTLESRKSFSNPALDAFVEVPLAHSSHRGSHSTEGSRPTTESPSNGVG